MKRLLTIALAGLVLLLGCAACRDGGGDGQSSGPDQVLRRGNVEAPATLDPWLAEDIHAFNVLVDLYEGLVAEDPSGNLVPGVAASWSVSQDGLLYTFELRDNALWSDGSSVVAADFVNGLRHLASPDTHSSYAFLLEPVVGFNDVKAGNSDQTELGVHAVDAATIEIRLSKPSPHFLNILAMPIAYPLHGGAYDPVNFREPDRFVGNGAYILERYAAMSTIRLRRNPAYWNSRSVAVDAVEYVPVADENAELNMYRSGELDITATIPPSHIELMRERVPGEVRIAPSLALYYFAFDLTEPPLDNLDLRRALTMAIDREQLVQLLGRGEQPAYAVVPPGIANYQGAAYSWWNLGQDERSADARRALRAAGYDTGNPLRLKLTYDAGGVHEKVALAVSAMWRETLNIEIELEKKEWQYFLDTRDDRPAWQVMRFAWFGDYNDASTFTDVFHSSSSQNLPLFRNDDYDRLLDTAASETDPEKRAAILRRAEQVLLDSYPIAPLYFYTSKHMVKQHVAGFEDNPLDRHPSRYLAIR